LTKKVSSKPLNLPNNDKKIIGHLTNELRNELKKPQGLLIEGHIKKTMLRLKELIEKEKPSIIISVGDVVSQNMIKFGLYMNVLIIDNKTMRKPIEPIVVNTDQTFYAKNFPGTITDEAWKTIKLAIKQKGQTKVIIDGEEDLLTLVTVLCAPEDAFVIYGQPHEGIVVVKVKDEKRKEMSHIIDLMKKSSKS
jgi:uncharacterized protein (UPF0218 family)